MFAILGMLTTILACSRPIPSFWRTEVPDLYLVLDTTILTLTEPVSTENSSPLRICGLAHVGVGAALKPARVLMWKDPNAAPVLSGPGLLSSRWEGQH